MRSSASRSAFVTGVSSDFKRLSHFCSGHSCAAQTSLSKTLFRLLVHVNPSKYYVEFSIKNKIKGSNRRINKLQIDQIHANVSTIVWSICVSSPIQLQEMQPLEAGQTGLFFLVSNHGGLQKCSIITISMASLVLWCSN